MAIVAPSRIRTGRGAEVWLFILSLALSIGGYALVGMNTAGALPADFFKFAGVLIAITVVLHVVIRWRARYADPLLVPLVMALNGIGLAMIYRIDIGLKARGLASGFGPNQLKWTVLCSLVACVVIIVLRDHRLLRRYTFTSAIVGIVLLLLPMVPGLGVAINGARLWIHLGPFSFQPAEVAKIFLAIFFAGYLVSTRDVLTLAGPKFLGLQLPRLRDLGPLILAWAGAILILVSQRDLGTSLMFFGLFVAVIYVATERVSWILIGLIMFAAGAAAAVAAFPHVAERFNIWLHALDPEVYNRAYGGSGQLVRGLFGLAEGGLTGTGWGEGYPQLVPYANSDFIASSIGEELGLTGLMAVLMIYVIIAQRGIRMAIGVRDGFGKLLASALAFTLAWQCFVVVGGVTRLIPLTGLTLPFMAAGGSSLLGNWIIIGLLVRISDSSRRPAEERKGEVSTQTAMAIIGADDGVEDEAGEGRALERAQDRAPEPAQYPGEAADTQAQYGREADDTQVQYGREAGRRDVDGNDDDFGPGDSPTEVVKRP